MPIQLPRQIDYIYTKISYKEIYDMLCQHRIYRLRYCNSAVSYGNRIADVPTLEIIILDGTIHNTVDGSVDDKVKYHVYNLCPIKKINEQAYVGISYYTVVTSSDKTSTKEVEYYNLIIGMIENFTSCNIMDYTFDAFSYIDINNW